jgi:hypothetical protein
MDMIPERVVVGAGDGDVDGGFPVMTTDRLLWAWNSRGMLDDDRESE